MLRAQFYLSMNKIGQFGLQFLHSDKLLLKHHTIYASGEHFFCEQRLLIKINEIYLDEVIRWMECFFEDDKIG
jgi:hypothetical protein